MNELTQKQQTILKNLLDVITPNDEADRLERTELRWAMELVSNQNIENRNIFINKINHLQEIIVDHQKQVEERLEKIEQSLTHLSAFGAKSGDIEEIQERIEQIEQPKKKKLGLNWNVDSFDSLEGATGNWYQVDIEDVFLKRSDIAKKRDLLRMIRACKKYKINSIGELMEKSPNEIIKMANMGPHSIIWINTILESLGLNLKKIAA